MKLVSNICKIFCALLFLMAISVNAKVTTFYSPILDPSNYDSIVSDSCSINFTTHTGAEGYAEFIIDSNAALLSAVWQYGDGHEVISTSLLSSHVYLKAGWFQVCVTGWYENNCKATRCDSIYIKIDSTTYCESNFNIRHTDDPYQVDFQNASAGNARTFHWTFGDGNESFEENPSHTYQTLDTFNVCLAIVGSSNHCTDTICKTIITQAPSDTNCFVNFNVIYANRGEIQLENLSDQSKITDYRWHYGDSYAYVNSYHARHTYQYSGWYDVCLRGRNNNGCEVTSCQTIYVDIDTTITCVADFEATQTSYSAVQFNNKSPRSASNYYWEFGDGEVSIWNDPLHTYSEPGTYNVCLTIFSNTYNCWDTYCEDVIVSEWNESNCKATFDYQQTPASNVVELLNITGGTSPENQLGNAIWIIEQTGQVLEGHRQSITFPSSGLYRVCLYIEDEENQCFDDTCMVISYSEDGGYYCNSDFSYQAVDGDSSVLFYNNSAGYKLTFAWDFGDGTTSTELEPDHIYAASGTYTVCLTVSSSSPSNCSDSYCQDVEILLDQDRGCYANFNHTQFYNSYSIYFENTSSSEQGNGELAVYSWDFGDNTFGIGANFTHQYDNAGTYNVCLSVFDYENQCFTDTCIYVIVNPISLACEANFTYSRDTTTDGMTYHFVNQSLGSNLQYEWVFYEGLDYVISNEENPSFTYNNPGIEEVRLTIYGYPSTQCYDEISKQIIIEPTGTINEEIQLRKALEKSAIAIYPNPTSNLIHISGLDQTESNSVLIYNLLGEPIKSFSNFTASSIDMQLFEAGVYFVQINDETPIRVVKY